MQRATIQRTFSTEVEYLLLFEQLENDTGEWKHKTFQQRFKADNLETAFVCAQDEWRKICATKPHRLPTFISFETLIEWDPRSMVHVVLDERRKLCNRKFIVRYKERISTISRPVETNKKRVVQAKDLRIACAEVRKIWHGALANTEHVYHTWTGLYELLPWKPE